MRKALAEVVDLFVEDWRLAAAMVIALVVAGLLVGPLGADGPWAGVLLAAAVIAGLFWHLG